MGMMEQMAADIAEIKTMLAAGAGAAPAAAAKKTPAAKKDEKAKPAFTAEQLRDQFIAVQKKHGDAEAKALIAECGFEKLANLVADTENWQSHMDKATAKLEEDVAGEEGDESGL